mgnify:FL=1
MNKKVKKTLIHIKDFLEQHVLKYMDDKTFLMIYFRIFTGKRLNLKNPQTFNEKIQWMKLYNQKSEYTVMADKYLVKGYVAKKIGQQYVIPLLGVWDSPDEICFDELPDRFVLKCNHNSGTGMCICTDKSVLDIEQVKKNLRKGLNENFFLHGREWVYKNIPRKIIAEQYMTDESGYELKDYKFFCFDGVPKLIEVDFDRFTTGHKRNLYTTDWKLMNAEIKYKRVSDKKIDKPQCLDELLKLAAKLSEGIPHVRVDFYVINEKIYFGELTFYHGSGLEKFRPESLGIKMGAYIRLPENSV